MVRQRYFKEVTLDIILLFCNLHSIFLMGAVNLQEYYFFFDLTRGIDGFPVSTGGSHLGSFPVKHIRQALGLAVCEFNS